MHWFGCAQICIGNIDGIESETGLRGSDGIIARGELSRNEVSAGIGQRLARKCTGRRVSNTSNVDRLAKNPTGSMAKDYKKLLLLAASDMNTYSRRVEEVLPNFAKSTETLDQSYSAHIGFANRETPDDVERIGSLWESLSQMLEILRPTKENIAHFGDSTRSIREQNLSKELNKAATLQSKTLDSVLAEIERLESFALRISFLMCEHAEHYGRTFWTVSADKGICNRHRRWGCYAGSLV